MYELDDKWEALARILAAKFILFVIIQFRDELYTVSSVSLALSIVLYLRYNQQMDN